jgi:hypothetical protein
VWQVAEYAGLNMALFSPWLSALRNSFQRLPNRSQIVTNVFYGIK